MRDARLLRLAPAPALLLASLVAACSASGPGAGTDADVAFPADLPGPDEGAADADGPDASRPGKAAMLATVARVNAAGPYAPDWESLKAWEPPAWYADARFGIFVHWGVYSVPAWWSEWYPHEMYQQGSLPFEYHRQNWGLQSVFGYKDFIPLFTADAFDPAAWMDLFVQAGARFVVPVAEHHDGFAMYDGGFNLYDDRPTTLNAMNQGPRRDVVGELAAAARAVGLHFGVSVHRGALWWWYAGGKDFESDVQDPAWRELYGPLGVEGADPDEPFLQTWLARVAEVVDRYRPELFYFDFDIGYGSFEPYRRQFASYYYNRSTAWGQPGIVNYKGTAMAEGTAVLDIERAGLEGISPVVWQTDTSVGNFSWGYVDPSFEVYKTPDRLVDILVDTVSRNGVLLLNVGPDAHGVIPEEQASLLRDLGAWLKVNGVGIYGSKPWKVFGEGPTKVPDVDWTVLEISMPSLTADDIRFTTRDGVLYAFFMEWPESGTVRIPSLGRSAGVLEGEVASVDLVGLSGAPLAFSRGDDALVVTLPADRPAAFAGSLAIRVTPVP